MRKLIWIIVTILVLGGLFWLSGSKKESEQPINIVALFPLTGGVASWGEASKGGVELAVEEINSRGGVNGHPIQIVYEDHRCDPKVALSIYQQRVVNQKIFISSSCSGTVLSIAPNLENDDALLLATVVASTKISSSSLNLFRNWTVETRQADLIGQKIKNSNYKKIGILYEETDYAKGLKLALEDILKNSAIEIVSESFVTNATDIRTQITKLKLSNPEAIFLSTQGEATSEIVLNQMEQLDFKPEQVFANDVLLGASKAVENHKEILEGALGGTYIVQSNKYEDFKNKYINKFGTESTHMNASAIAYDSIYFLKEAMEENVYTESIKNYLKTNLYTGVTGNIKFNDNNDRDGIGYVLSEVRGGKVTPLEIN